MILIFVIRVKLFEPIGNHKNKYADPSNPFVKLYGPFSFRRFHIVISKDIPPPLLIHSSSTSILIQSPLRGSLGLYNLEVFEDRVEQKIERVNTIPRFSKTSLNKRLKGLIQSQGLIILRFFDHAVHTRERAHNLEVFDRAVQTGERSKKLERILPDQEGMLSDLHQLTFMLFRSDERV
ncbi:unnamed protein product [Lactuca saligna]|uniref:Uncharacterized protein n=1 Tax=Lactuca saligna TaxID=75948 RepID=A0AA36E2C5_LACSI|nr:unnamed protein product [Lactuca saligna]